MFCVLCNKSDFQSFLESLRKRKLRNWKGKKHEKGKKGKCHFIAFGTFYLKKVRDLILASFLH